MSILVTGFSAFPGAPRNPTEDMVAALQQNPQHGTVFRAVTLPVVWEASFAMLRHAIADTAATTVLLFGLHQRAERLRVELQSRNHRELGRVDAVGDFPSGPAVLDGPEMLPARLPWAEVAAALRGANVPFEWSTDAGGYLCNDTLYRLAFAAGELGVERFGFFHVPLSDERVADIVEAAKPPDVFCSLPAAAIEAAALAMVDRFAASAPV